MEQSYSFLIAKVGYLLNSYYSKERLLPKARHPPTSLTKDRYIIYGCFSGRGMKHLLGENREEFPGGFLRLAKGLSSFRGKLEWGNRPDPPGLLGSSEHPWGVVRHALTPFAYWTRISFPGDLPAQSVGMGRIGGCPEEQFTPKPRRMGREWANIF